MRLSPSHPAVALGLLALAMALMPLNDVIIKTIGPGHEGFSRLSIDGPLLSLTLLIFCRSLLIFAVLAYFPATIASLQGLSLRLWTLLLTRGAMLGISMMLFFVGLALMPLWQAVSVFFISPLLISLLSVPFLGERLGLWRVLAQLMGFGGVLVMVLPGAGSDGLDWSFALPFLSALYYALYNILTRLIGDQASTLSMTNIQHLGYMLVGLIFAVLIWLLPLDASLVHSQNPGLAFILRPWVMPTWEQIGFILLCGAMIAFLSYASSNAYAHLEAKFGRTLRICLYAYMPLSLFWSILIWNEYPSMYGWIGGALILGAGFLTVFRENIRGVDIATMAPMPMAASVPNLEEAAGALPGKEEA